MQSVSHAKRRVNLRFSISPNAKVNGLARAVTRIERALSRARGNRRRARLAERIQKLTTLHHHLVAAVEEVI